MRSDARVIVNSGSGRGMLLVKQEIVCQPTQNRSSMSFMGKIPEKKPISASRRDLMRLAAGHHLAIDLPETTKLALPMVLTQLGQIATMMTDLAFIGRIGPEAVASVALSGRVFLVSFTFGVGLLAAIAPLAA